MGETTILIQGAFAGSEADLRQLIDRVYGRLEQLAGRRLAALNVYSLERGDLVHNTYFRLRDRMQSVQFSNSREFFGYVSVMMSNAIIDAIRSGKRDVDLDALPPHREPAAPEPSSTVQLIRELIDQRRKSKPLQGDILDLRVFNGMTAQEAAAVLGITYQECRYQSDVALDWLERQLKSELGDA